MWENSRWNWNFFRLENEHLNNCGQFRAIKDIPLPFRIRVEGDSDAEEEEVEEEEVEEVHETLEPDQRKSLSAEGIDSGAAVPISNSSTPSRQLSRQHSQAHTIQSIGNASRTSFPSPGSGPRRRPSRASPSPRPSSSALSALSALVEGTPMLVPRSRTFVEDAMVEAGFGDHQREHLVGGLNSIKFYDRRDFDSKIVDVPEILLSSKRRPLRSSASTSALAVDTTPMQSSSGTSPLTGLGMEYPSLTNQSSGSGSGGLKSPSTPVSLVPRRRETMGNRVKAGLFGSSNDDSDDDEDDEEDD